MAQPVDPSSLQPTGDVFPVIEQVRSALPIVTYFLYSVLRNGIILHLPGALDLRQHAFFDRSGKQLTTIGGLVSTPGRVALSPDEKRMVSERGGAGKVDRPLE